MKTAKPVKAPRKRGPRAEPAVCKSSCLKRAKCNKCGPPTEERGECGTSLCWSNAEAPVLRTDCMCGAFGCGNAFCRASSAAVGYHVRKARCVKDHDGCGGEFCPVERTKGRFVRRDECRCRNPGCGTGLCNATGVRVSHSRCTCGGAACGGGLCPKSGLSRSACPCDAAKCCAGLCRGTGTPVRRDWCTCGNKACGAGLCFNTGVSMMRARCTCAGEACGSGICRKTGVAIQRHLCPCVWRRLVQANGRRAQRATGTGAVVLFHPTWRRGVVPSLLTLRLPHDATAGERVDAIGKLGITYTIGVTIWWRTDEPAQYLFKAKQTELTADTLNALQLMDARI